MADTTQSGTGNYPTRQQYEEYARRYFAQYGRYPPNHAQYMSYYASQVAPEPDPDKPVQGSPTPVHHALDHRMLIPMLVILLLVIAGGAGFFWYNSSIEEQTEQIITEAPAAPEQTAEEILSSQTQFTPAIVATPDTCYEMEEGRDRDECYLNLALTSFEDDYCEEIDGTLGETSKDDCYMKMALSTLTGEYCNLISSQSGEISVDACYMELALRLEEPDICFFIEDIDLESWSADACLTRMAAQQEDDVLCGLVYTEQRNESQYSVESCLAQFGMTRSDYDEKYFGE